jgi:hypothetical protein
MNIVVSLRGNPDEFIQFPELPLREGRGEGSYSECTLKNPNQLPAIAMYIQKAYAIYKEGRGRKKKHPRIAED